MQGIPQIGPVQTSETVPVQGSGIVLALGEVVRGEVINILPDAVSMRVKQEILLAKADIPLEQGKFYLFRVESLDQGGAKLKVIQALADETEVAGSAILKALDGLNTLPHDQLIAFKKILENIPESAWKRRAPPSPLEKTFKNADSLTGDTLKESLDASGGYFETKLRALISRLAATGDLAEREEVDQIIQNDLKGNLLKLKEELLKPAIQDALKENHTKTGVFSEAVDKLLAHIEQQQFTSKMNTAFQTFIPVLWQGLKDGKLTFKESYHAHEGEVEHDCVIALDLDKVGRLVGHVRLFADRLNLRFFTENPKLTALLEENKSLLEKQLMHIGLVCNSLVITEEKTIDFENMISPFELDIKV